MKTVALVLLVMFAVISCKDSYRYQCQNPDNFETPSCSKPRCEFDQTCPEYLVAPVLEKKIGQPKTDR